MHKTRGANAEGSVYTPEHPAPLPGAEGQRLRPRGKLRAVLVGSCTRQLAEHFLLSVLQAYALSELSGMTVPGDAGNLPWRKIAGNSERLSAAARDGIHFYRIELYPSP